jgi:Putative peptidoglycan binding domain
VTAFAPRARRARLQVLAGMGLALLAAVVLIVGNPSSGSGKPGGAIADNSTPTSLITVTRRELSSQTQVNGTLGFADASSIRVPAGTAPVDLAQAEQSVTSAEAMLDTARASMSADIQTLAGAQATLSAAEQKEAVDCAGEGAAESASARPAAGEEGGGGGGSGPCASDLQPVSTSRQSAAAAGAKLAGDRSSISSAERALAGAEASLSAARSSAALYDPGATFTMLPAVGQVIGRGQSLYEIAGQPVLLLYGSVLPARAFIAGMPPGRDVAELNANLEALGYGQGLAGGAFTASTAAAIRALESAHGLTPTSELALGSVVFEPGPVRVTGVTPTLGASVAPGPVLAITSTARQVTVALSTGEQSSVKAGDTVTITLPDNQTTPGVITSVGTVAKSPSGKGVEEAGKGGEEGGPTVEVDIAPTEPATTGRLDEAPVNVSITTDTVPSALAVPVDALLALAGGGFAVEVLERGVHRLVAVDVGLFDDAEGLVQVSGAQLRRGQRVVVPAP